MRYLITTNNSEPAYTRWFDAENNFNASVGMVVFDLYNGCYTTDGITWKEIEIDHL